MTSDDTHNSEQNSEHNTNQTSEENLQPLPPLTSERVRPSQQQAEDQSSPIASSESEVSEADVSDYWAAESPVSESPVSDSPVSESPVSDSPVSESPVSESPVSESPVSESPVSESPVSASETEDTVDLDAIYEQTQESPPEQGIQQELSATVEQLQRRKRELEEEITQLEAKREQLLTEETAGVQGALERMVQEGVQELEERKQALQISVDKLERRRDRIREEMRASFSGVSQDIAIRVKGFKDYLVGSLQDLVATAEQLDLPDPSASPPPPSRSEVPRTRPQEETPTPKFAKDTFQDQRRQVSKIIDQYRTMPDYYGPPWQLRRTFEPVHAERVQDWFFQKGGRGAIRSLGSRLQNILVASAAISILRRLYDERVRVLVLANSPERLGEWRRGLQDCLGISRSDFGPSRGIGLFESPEALVQKAERLVDNGQLPIIVMDETEDMINLALLQFPLWIAFAPNPSQMSSYVY
ncbi:DUF3086 domain-containing protein [Spirulina sp. CS-785/01]|uniref:DUF3086 domain-containing protein n=1 Tax=Spirulina sp. CS-785/01 TaxID=3021716 RepID=UPI00232DD9AC|nr:DUF3086 domain-containing protein [Spirulina sp. CS-785/01]MDB9314623.1 DUF3086 domain-containing protein [Spirulina sp. CS-785/01]